MQRATALALALLVFALPACEKGKEPTALKSAVVGGRSTVEAETRKLPKNIPTSPDENVDWSPVVEMNGQVFPSFILAASGEKVQNKQAGYYGDKLGLFGATVVAPHDGAEVRVVVDASPYARQSSYEATLATEGKKYEIFPLIDYQYSKLRSIESPRQASVRIALYVDGERVGQKVKRARVRSVNEVPFAFYHRNGERMDLTWMFAAYVNEHHPAVDRLLREALDTEIVNGFYGYQRGKEAVRKQVFALWHVLQERGFQYSNVAAASGETKGVYSQRVRFIDDALATSQANCVDGTVLLASLLRAIGIDPFVIVKPGHMFLGYYTTDDHSSSAVLETTMLGSVDLDEAERSWEGVIREFAGQDPAREASMRSFLAAKKAAFDTYREVKDSLGKKGYYLIDIADARQRGIHPIQSVQ